MFTKIAGLRHFPLEKLLTDKYLLKPQEATQLADFLMQVLKWYSSDRASAKTLLDHPWLAMPDDYHPRMSELEFQKY